MIVNNFKGCGIFKKSRTKLSLIEDYIKVFNINSFFKRLKFAPNYNLVKVDTLFAESERLLFGLEKLLFKFGMIDLSFLILKKQLKEGQNNFNNLDNKVCTQLFDKMIFCLEQINKSLKLKLKTLHLNEIEQKFVLN